MTPIIKNIYVEHPLVASMSSQEVEDFRYALFFSVLLKIAIVKPILEHGLGCGFDKF
jgi:hypothetical protein